MPDYLPAVLLEAGLESSTPPRIVGEAIMTIFRDHHGAAQVAGTFRSDDERLQDLTNGSERLFEYEGTAFEGDRGCEIRALVSVLYGEDGLHELEASAEPVIVRCLD
jgi:hypothetical protein